MFNLGKIAVNSLSIFQYQNTDKYESISRTQFDLWLRHFSFRGLSGNTIGRQFCHDHGLSDFILYFTLDNNQSIDYIKKNYLTK
jgi:hypothetical protein